MSDFFAMGGYAVFVWGSYGAGLVIFVWNALVPRLERRALRQRLRQATGGERA